MRKVFKKECKVIDLNEYRKKKFTDINNGRILIFEEIDKLLEEINIDKEGKKLSCKNIEEFLTDEEVEELLKELEACNNQK